MKLKPRIMYIEHKGMVYLARPHRLVTFPSRQSIYYQGRRFHTLAGSGSRQLFRLETGEQYWISGCKKRAAIDSILELSKSTPMCLSSMENIRKLPQTNISPTIFKCNGKYAQ